VKYAQLGNSGIRVSRLCFGTLTMGPLQRALPPRQGADLLIAARDLGVNFLDTAQLYGTYEHIALALRSAPDYQVATKAYCYDEPTARQALDEALGKLRGAREKLGGARGKLAGAQGKLSMPRVALFLLHEMESIHTLRGHEDALSYLEKRRKAGDIGALGISTHHVAAVRAALDYDVVEVIHPIINLRGIGIVDGSRQDMEAALADAHAAGKGIYAMKALGGGHLCGGAQGAFDYIQGLPFVDSVAVGMQTLSEVRANAALFSGRQADEGDLAALRAQRRELLVQDWCEGCGRCVARCRFGAMGMEARRAAPNPEKCVLCGYCAGACPQFCIKVI